MSLRSELALIPKLMWLLGIAVYGCLAFFLFTVATQHMPGVVRYLFAFGLPVIAGAIWVMTGYVYGDAKRRNMRPVMWALLALLIPNAIGFILYFILREPITDPCRQCGKPVGRQFGFCPLCGTRREQACPQCGAATEAGWAHCPRCGASLRA